MLILFNKPFGVLSQFTREPGSPASRTLAEFIALPDVYAAGRLDADSEGLLVLTDNGALQAAIASASPHARKAANSSVTKTYWVQVEGTATEEHAKRLARGVTLTDGVTRPAQCRVLGIIDAPWPRVPPIRVRKNVADSWIELTINEGRNRQVRRMTAHVGLPTLRLIRVAVGPWRVNGIVLGEMRVITDAEAFNALEQ